MQNSDIRWRSENLTMATVYDLCVVGAGLVGSAAARHATLGTGDEAKARVCLVGPLEPKTKDVTSSRTIFGCHYDEGRIIRDIDPCVTWSVLASHSIQRFRDIEKVSGIQFFSEVGFIWSGTDGNETLNDVGNTKEAKETDTARRLTAAELQNLFPYFNYGKHDLGFYQKTNGGHISPRRMVLAQQTAAKQQGCDVIYEVVTQVVEDKMADENVMEVKTESGRCILAKKVLLATNAFTNLCDLLPRGQRLNMWSYPSCVAFVEISEESAKRLSGMPPVIYRGKGAEDWKPPAEAIGTSDDYAFYMLPPIRYPDGRFYMKQGCYHNLTPALETLEDMKAWYCNPPPRELVLNTASVMTSFVKGIEPLSITGDTCTTAYTPSKHPYIDKISENLTVAVGGNGRAAKSADEIGRLGMELALNGRWDTDLPREKFRVILANPKL
ncbi:uncharacterized protein LOC135472636 isoform X2 [Liolophura sinensis]|uniref:uncharacterized protein LOC135472636 isoform X2 n=1 Tax=Liolophura sinensis TaxID=3198878 RepID=UPI0031595666